MPLLVELMRRLPEPFGILWVLTVSRCGNAPGRYQSPYPTDRMETIGFLNTYRDFFERDGRHHIWVTSLPTNSTVVYDNHNLIYAYAPLDEFQLPLAVGGLARGAVKIPAPHTHLYNVAFDDVERRLMAHWSWRQSPIQPDDDP